MHKSYPIHFNGHEQNRLKKQSKSLSDSQLVELSKNSQSCLEIGCGVGSNIDVITKGNKNITYHGIDCCRSSIEAAKKILSKSNISFSIETAEKLTFKEEFDLVVIRLVLWGAPGRTTILTNAFNALKPGGKIYVYEPDDQYLLLYPDKPKFINYLSKWQLTSPHFLRPSMG